MISFLYCIVHILVFYRRILEYITMNYVVIYVENKMKIQVFVIVKSVNSTTYNLALFLS